MSGRGSMPTELRRVREAVVHEILVVTGKRDRALNDPGGGINSAWWGGELRALSRVLACIDEEPK